MIMIYRRTPLVLFFLFLAMRPLFILASDKKQTTGASSCSRTNGGNSASLKQCNCDGLTGEMRALTDSMNTVQSVLQNRNSRDLSVWLILTLQVGIIVGYEIYKWYTKRTVCDSLDPLSKKYKADDYEEDTELSDAKEYSESVHDELKYVMNKVHKELKSLLIEKMERIAKEKWSEQDEKEFVEKQEELFCDVKHKKKELELSKQAVDEQYAHHKLKFQKSTHRP